MVKFLISNHFRTETSKYTREFNTYGVGEELLYPIEINDSFLGQPQPDATLATYLIKLKEFQKSYVEIEKNRSKAWFLNIFILNYSS